MAKYHYFGIRVKPTKRINKDSVEFIMKELGFTKTGQLFTHMIESQFGRQLTAYENFITKYPRTDKEMSS
jgi:Ca2+-binding EF-hand superfamily protein